MERLRLARIEYLSDLIEARAALKEIETEGTIPWEQIKADLGLDSEQGTK